MTSLSVTAIRIEEGADVTLTEIVRASGLEEWQVVELVRYGALVPRNPHESPMRFESRSLLVARRACRLAQDLELDAQGVSVALGLLERIEALEREVAHLRALGR